MTAPIATTATWTLDHGSPARWIFPARPADAVNQYVDFLHPFDAPARDGDGAVLRISADTDFVVWLNGELLGHGQYSDYPDQKTYELFDAGDALRPGPNTLAITVWYNGRNSSVYRRGEPGLLYELRAGATTLVASGTQTLCRPNPCYHSGPIAPVSHQLIYTFGYDARGGDAHSAPTYSPKADWHPLESGDATLPSERLTLAPRPVARLQDGGPTATRLHEFGRFRREQAPAATEEAAGRRLADGTLVSPAVLMQRDELRPSTTRDPLDAQLGPVRGEAMRPLTVRLESLGDCDGVYLVLDMGREEAGLLELDLEADAGVICDIGYGEHLDDGRPRTSVGGRNFAARYICREGRQRFRHHFLRWAGRYLSIHVQSPRFTLHALRLLRRDYPLQEAGRLALGSERQRQILQVARRTLSLCMHEHYEDTPWREQALYANDSRTQALCGYFAFRNPEFPASSMTLLGRGLRPDGFLELTAPAKPRLTIPSFTLVWMLAVRDHYLYTGDPALAQAFLPQIESMLQRFLDERQAGLLPLRQAEGIWHFYDWSAGMSGYTAEQFAAGLTVDAPLNCYLILALEALQQMRHWLGLQPVAAYATAITSLREAVNGHFYDRADDTVRTHQQATEKTELTQALALLAGVLPEPRRSRVLDRLNHADSGLAKAGLSQSLYTYEARLLDRQGAGPRVLAEIDTIWGRILDAGATTFWETETGASDFADAGSLCHGWSAVPLYVYYHDFLGLRPLAPGFRRVAIEPVTEGPPCCSGSIPVPGGRIDLSWYRLGRQVRYCVSAPPDCEIELRDPTGILLRTDAI